MKQIRKFSKAELEKAGIPKDVQWVITNACDLAFGGSHCAVPHSAMPELLKNDIGEILEIVDVIAALGLEAKILGGNLSDNRQAFLAVVDRMNKRDVNYAITDNATNRAAVVEAINRYGVKGFVFSLDTLRSVSKYRYLPGIDLGGCSPRKSDAALQLIPEIRGKVPYVAVNTIIHAGNLEQIVPIVKHCTDELKNVIVNLCPLIHGSLLDEQGQNQYIFRGPTEMVLPYVFKTKHKVRFVKLMNKLIELKESGYAIGVPVEFLELLKENTCGKFTWNCGKMEKCPILRLFPNGKFGVCSDLVGSDMYRAGLTPFNLLSTNDHVYTEQDKQRNNKGGVIGFTAKLTAEDLARNFAKINEAWLADRDRLLCCQKSGCVWSNILIAWIYQQKGYGTLSATKKNL
ncbi:hypothetical protein KJ575_02780 [Patescibacteria group bacterium]|nr:hypothetical protein [Patescibacteria group bacterium]